MVGQLVAADRDSYQYLVESIVKVTQYRICHTSYRLLMLLQFPSQQEFANMIEDAGFHLAGKGWEDLTFGVAAIHTGLKL